ncbi:hypothetical protein ISS06_01225 [Patescibacteria group bacterium]|nr:hypothetical protein [Patescibacteria group bacterium]
MKKIPLLISLIAMLGFLFLPALVSAQNLGNDYLTNFGNAAGFGTADLTTVIGNVIKIVLSLMGMIAAIFLIVGGFMWMTSAGNEDKIKKAKGIMGAAVTGIVIVLVAYAAASFIINQLATVTTA